jgi:hypothetical protein
LAGHEQHRDEQRDEDRISGLLREGGDEMPGTCSEEDDCVIQLDAGADDEAADAESRPT